MGLDTVEIVMAIEERFGIDIPNDEAENLFTTRDLIEFVYGKVRHNIADKRVCLSQRAFYRIRRQLQEKLDLSRDAVRPKTKWADIIPLEGRREIWADLTQSMNLTTHAPTLERAPLLRLVVVFSPLLSGAIAFAAMAAASVPAAGIAALTVGSITAWLAIALTRRQQIYFGPFLQTVGDTANALALHRPAEFRAGLGWTRDEVRATIRGIMIEHLGVDADFSDDARIVDDLGAD